MTPKTSQHFCGWILRNWSSVVYTCNGILLRHKKKKKFSIYGNMDGLGGHYAKWNKSNRERQVLCDIISSVHGDSPGKKSGVGCHAILQGLFPTQGSNPESPALQVDSLAAEPQRKPKNTGVGSLSLLQGIFPTQESNRGLLHCRLILYQLSYQGSQKNTTHWQIWQNRSR